MKVKSVVRVLRVVRVALLRLFPADDLADVLDHGLPFGDVLQGKHALAMHTRAAHLDALSRRVDRAWAGGGNRFFGHGLKNLLL